MRPIKACANNKRILSSNANREMLIRAPSRFLAHLQHHLLVDSHTHISAEERFDPPLDNV